MVYAQEGKKPVKQKVVMMLAPEYFEPKPQESAAGMLWLVYGNIRLEDAEKHEETWVLDRESYILPSFKEEVEARRKTIDIYHNLKKKEPGLSDQYWDQVDKVVKSGFIEEYVWEFLRRPNWPEEQAPKRLQEFAVFREKELKNHIVVTLVNICKKQKP